MRSRENESGIKSSNWDQPPNLNRLFEGIQVTRYGKVVVFVLHVVLYVDQRVQWQELLMDAE